MSGFTAAGGKYESGFFSSSFGTTVCVGRPDSAFNPPLDGPELPASEMFITVRGSAARWLNRVLGARSSTAANTPCANSESVIIRCRPAGGSRRSRSTSVTSTKSALPGHPSDQSDVQHTRFLELVEHFHQFLIGDAGVAAQIDLLRIHPLDLLADALFQHIERHRFVAEQCAVIALVRRRHRHKDAL